MSETKRYSHKSPGRGGARPGAGRPRGSTTKVRIEDLLEDIEVATNMPFTERVALNYALAIDRSDWSRVENYDRALLNKMVADKQELEVTESEDTVATKQAAFRAALTEIAGIQEKGK